jgi:hypothetical protein
MHHVQVSFPQSILHDDFLWAKRFTISRANCRITAERRREAWPSNLPGLEEAARLGLQDGDEIAGPDIGLVFGPFLRGQLALVAFLGHLRNSGSNVRPSSKFHQRTCGSQRQSATERVKHSVENGGFG